MRRLAGRRSGRRMSRSHQPTRSASEPTRLGPPGFGLGAARAAEAGPDQCRRSTATRSRPPGSASDSAAASSRSTAWTSRCRPARSTGSSGRTARARPRRSGCCSGSSSRRRQPPGTRACRCPGTTNDRAVAGRRAGRGSGVLPAPVRPGQPGPAGRRRPDRRPATAPARIEPALDRVGLLAAAGKRYRAYSLGMKQRLAIAAGLLRPRDLVILDEPTNGLDPQGTREVRVADPADRRRRHHGVRVLAPAGRGRADLLARGRHARRRAGVPGHAGGDARPRLGPDPGPHPRARAGRSGAVRAGPGRRDRRSAGR